MSDLTRDHSDSIGDGDFQQFTGAFDRPIAPASSFADALKTRLLAESRAAPASQTTSAVPKATSSHVDVSSPNPFLPARTGRAFRPSWAGAFETAAAVALVVAIVLTAVLNGRPAFIFDFDESGQPTAPAPAPNIVNWGGDAGRSQYYGDDVIDTSVPPRTVQIGASDTRTVGPGLIVGDSWYGWTFRSGSHEFQRVDVQTRRQVWVKNYRTWGTLASDGERIFTLLVEESGTMEAAPVGIDIRTGQIAWRGPELAPFPSFVAQMPDAMYLAQPIIDDNGPVVIGATVFFADGMGTTVSLNSSTGEEQWRYVPPATLDRTSLVPDGGRIVADEQALFVTLPDESIAKLDPISGKAIGELDIATQYGFGDVQQLDMQLSGDTLVVSYHAQTDSSESTVVIMFAADDLTLLNKIDGLFGTGVLTESSLFVYAGFGERAAQIHGVDLVTGKLSEGFGGGALAGDVQLSASGDTLIATSSTGITFYFSMTTHEFIESYRIDHPGPITPVGSPVQVVDGRPVVVWKTGSNDRIVPLEPVATPAP